MLVFPKDLGSNAQSSNYMGFQAYTIIGGVGSGKSDRSYNQSGDPVYLPIPVEGVQDQYQNSWGSENVSMTRMAIGGAVAGAGAGITSTTGLLDTLKSRVLGNMAGNIEGTPLANPLSALTKGFDTGNVTMDQMKGMAMGIVKGASPLAVGMAVGTLGNAVVQSTGVAGFEETSVSYTGPQFRSFSFNFSLKPLTLDEQTTIESIVEFFKYAAAPQELSGALYRIYSLPKVFEIKFYHKDGENEALTKIGKCALQNIGIKYGGDRFQTFAAGHAPVQTDISLQFIELVLQTQNVMGHAGHFAQFAVAVDDFGGVNDNVGGNRAKALAAAKAKAAAAAADKAAAANVDSFAGGGNVGPAGGGAAGTGAVDTFGGRNDRMTAGEFADGSPMKAIKSKASGGASFIPDGGAG